MDFDWFWEALREAGVDRIVFGATAPVQRWGMDKLILPAMRRVRSSLAADVTTFQQMSKWRRWGFALSLLYCLTALGVGNALSATGTDAPFVVQVWVATVGLYLFCGSAWLAGRWTVRKARLLMV